MGPKTDDQQAEAEAEAEEAKAEAEEDAFLWFAHFPGASLRLTNRLLRSFMIIICLC